jgi:hypothetical protein
MEKFLGTKHEIQCEVFFNTKVQNIIYDLSPVKTFQQLGKEQGQTAAKSENSTTPPRQRNRIMYS